MRAGVAVVLGIVVAGGAWALLAARSSQVPDRKEAADAGHAAPGGSPGLSTRHPTRAGTSGSVRNLRRVAGAASIHGMVRRGNDPVGARVEVFGGGDRPLDSLVPSSALRLADFFPADADVPAARVASVKTKPDGTYRVADLPTGAYVIRATTADGARGFAFAKVKKHDEDVEADVEIAAGALTLEGRVLDGERGWNGRVAIARAGPDSLADWARGLVVEPVLDGRFAARRLDAGDHLVAALDARGGLLAATVVAVPSPGEVVLRLGAPFDTGRRVVAKATGAPIEGAEAICYSVEADAVLATAKSGADGDLSIPVLPDCLWRISAPGFATQIAEAERFFGDVLLEPAARIEGRVTSFEGGAPVGGILVRARQMVFDPYWGHGKRHFALDPSAVSDADGRYVLDDVSAGEHELYAVGDGWISKGLGTEESQGYVPHAVRTTGGQTESMDIAVVRTAALEGRVLASTGEPVHGRRVTCERADGTSGVYRAYPAVHVVARERSLRTDSLGRFRFEGLVSGLAVTVDVEEVDAGIDGSVARTVSGDAAGPFVPAPGDTLHVEIRLVAPRRVLATVVDDDSPPRPVPGARVTVVEEEVNLDHAFRQFGAAPTTDAEGRASILMPPGGPLVAHAWLSNRVPGWAADVPVLRAAAPGAPMTVTLVFPRGLSIAGRVVAQEGADAAGVSVYIRGSGVFLGSDESDSRGRFRFEGLSAGAWALNAHGSAGEASARVEAGAQDVTLTLSRLPADAKDPSVTRVRVRVLSPAGEDVPGASVERMVLGDDPVRTATRDGSLEFPSAETAAWYFATAGGEAALGCALVGPVPASDRDVVVRLPTTRRSAGVVTDATGAPIAGAALRLRRILPKELATVWAEKWTDAGATRTDAKGNFEFDGLGAFAHELTVTGPVALGTLRGLAVPPEGEMKIVLAPAAEVRGVVRTAAGRPLAGAAVWARFAGDPYFRPSAAAKTDASGRFRFDRLPKGPVAIGASPEGANRELYAQRDRTIEAGTGGEFEIVLPPTADLLARVERMPVWPAQLAIDGTSIGIGDVHQAADGGLRFVALPTDLTYTLWAPLGDRAAYRTGLRAGLPEVTIPSEPFGEIHGRIKAPAGFVDFRVRAEQGIFALYGAADLEGQFRLGGLTPGPWKVTVDAYRGAWNSSPKLTSTLTAEPGASLEFVLRER